MQTMIRKKESIAMLLTVFVFAGSVLVSACGLLYAASQKDLVVDAQPTQAALVNINKASSEELQMVRGIGPAIAERVIQYLNEHGRFERIDDLVNVRGIGYAKFQKIKTQLTV